MTYSSHLATLETSGLVRLVQTQPDLIYLFRHALVQEAAYESMLKIDRQHLHQLVGEALEAIFPNQLDEPVAGESLNGLLAYHYSHANLWEKTLLHAQLAAARAKQQYASPEALVYYALALDALDQLQEQPGRSLAALQAQRFDILSERHGVWTLLGQFDHTSADLNAMIDLGRQMNDPARLSDALVGAGYLSLNSGEGNPRPLLEEAIAIKRQLNDRIGLVDSLNTLGTFCAGVGQTQAGLAAFAEAYALSLAGDDLQALARSEWSQGGSYYEAIGDYDKALQHLERALSLSRSLNNRGMECGSLMMIGATYVRTGEFAAGGQYLEQAIALAQQIGDQPAEAWAVLYRSWIQREEGRLEHSKSGAQMALDVARHSKNVNLIWYASYSLARLHLAAGEPGVALEYAEECYRMMTGAIVWGIEYTRSAGLLARVYAMLGRAGEAQRCARIALEKLAASRGEGYTEMQLIYGDCYAALSAAGAPDALGALALAHEGMLARAATLGDPQRRAQFLRNLAGNREIQAAWEAFAAGAS